MIIRLTGAPGLGMVCWFFGICALPLVAATSDLPVGTQVLGSDTVGTADLAGRQVYPLGVVHVGEAPVSKAMAASADEQSIFVISDKNQGQITVYDMESEQRADIITLSTLPLTSIITAPDGNSLLVASGVSGKAQVERVDIATREHTATLVLSGTVAPLRAVTVAPHSSRVLFGSGTPGGGIVVLDPETFHEERRLPVAPSVGGLNAVSTLTDGTASYFLSDSSPPKVVGVDLETWETTLYPWVGWSSSTARTIVAARNGDDVTLIVGGSPNVYRFSRYSVKNSWSGFVTFSSNLGPPTAGFFDETTNSAIFTTSGAGGRLLEVSVAASQLKVIPTGSFSHFGAILHLPGRGELLLAETGATGQGRLVKLETSRRARPGAFSTLPADARAAAFSASEDAIYLGGQNTLWKHDAGSMERIAQYAFPPAPAILHHIAMDEAGGRLILVGATSNDASGTLIMRTVDARTMEEIGAGSDPAVYPLAREPYPGSVVVVDGTTSAILVGSDSVAPRLYRVDMDSMEVAATSPPLSRELQIWARYGIPTVDAERGKVYIGFVDLGTIYDGRLKEYDLQTLEELRTASVVTQHPSAAANRVATAMVPGLNALYFSGAYNPNEWTHDTALVDLETFNVQTTGRLLNRRGSYESANPNRVLVSTFDHRGEHDPIWKLLTWYVPFRVSYVSFDSYHDTNRNRLVELGANSGVDLNRRKEIGIISGYNAQARTGAFAYGAGDGSKGVVVEGGYDIRMMHRQRYVMVFDASRRGYVESVSIPFPTTEDITVMAFDDAAGIVYAAVSGNRKYNDRSQVLKIDLADSSVTGNHAVGQDSRPVTALALDLESRSLLAWVASPTPRLVRLDADTMEEIESITMPIGDAGVHTAVMVPGHYMALLARTGPPGSVIRVQLDPLQRLGAVSLPAGSIIPKGGLSVNPESLQAMIFADRNRLYPFDATDETLFQNAAPIMYGGEGLTSGVGVTIRPVMGTTMWDFALQTARVSRVDASTGAYVLENARFPLLAALGGAAGLFPQPGRIQAVSRSLQSWSTGSAEQINLVPVNMPHWGEMTEVRMHSHKAAGNLRVAIYADNVHETLLWTSPLVPNTAEEEEMVFQIADGTPDALILNPGSYYIAWITDTDEQTISHTPGGESLAVPYQLLDMPNRLPVQPANPLDVTWTVYATYTALPQPSLLHLN